MQNKQEQAIIKRAKRFDGEALEEIFDTYSPGIYRYAFRLLGDAELASDCMSETFSRFLSALKQDSGPDNYLQAYLYRIAHNWITDHYRRKGSTTLPLDVDIRADSNDEPHQSVAEEMERQRLLRALFLLTPDQRQVIVLRYLEGLEHEVIAQSMNKPVGSIKALQHRAVESLRRILTADEVIKQ